MTKEVELVEPQRWRFTSIEAAEAAHEVVHHTPDTPWDRVPMPANAEAAASSVRALADEFDQLPPSIRGALGRATRNAAQLSDDRLQGLAELLQNADDVGADEAFFFVDDDRLLFGHNGSDLTLPDVWGLTIPWLSEKSDQADAVGRFGIGLKTLQSLSETMEAHNGYFGLRLGRSILSAIDADPDWPSRPAAATTVFVVPFQRGATTQSEVADWLKSWDDAGLLFLRTLRSVTLLDLAGASIGRLKVNRGQRQHLHSTGGPVTRTRVTAGDGRTWLHYARNAPSPQSERAGKSQTDTTSVAVAFPQFVGDQGHIHVGLPVKEIGLPFRLSGQFDPLANRRGIADTQWNAEVLELVSRLWVDAALDLFQVNARRGWAAVPLYAEFEADAQTSGSLRATLTRSLMGDARLAFAEAVRIDGGQGLPYSLPDLAFEISDLTGILSDDDIRLLAGTAGVIGSGSRSKDDRWRAVLSDLGRQGAKIPVLVDATRAVRLLSDPERPIAFVADLTAVVVAVARDQDEDLQTALENSPCLVLAQGTRLKPAEAIGLRILLPTGASRLWSTLGIGGEVHGEYGDRPGWPTVASWLEARGSLRLTGTGEDVLRVLAEAGRQGVELPRPLTDQQADALRSALESIDESARPVLGAGIGLAVRLEATVYLSDGTRKRTFARPADAYFIEKEKNTWSIAARKTPGLVWLHRRYSEDLRAETGRSGIGAQRLFRLLGAESVPRLVPLPNDDRYYKRYVYYEHGLWRHAPGSPDRRKKQMLAISAQCTLHDLASPDLDRVLADIAKERRAQDRRRRANALLGCLARNWDRLQPHAKVPAANPVNGWSVRGEVDAWWVSQAASIPWLTNGRGRPAAPGDLRLKTLTNEAMHGTNPALYLAEGFDQPTHRDILSALGVEGNPTVEALIGRLVEIRTTHLAGHVVASEAEPGHGLTVSEAADLAAPIYQALAAEVQGVAYQRRIGSMTAAAARAHFDRGDGLIITNLGWRRTSATLSGDPIFGDLAPFVPAVADAEPLWTALSIRRPNADDAKRILKLLAKQSILSTDDRQIMLEGLRLLARTPAERLGQLRRLPVYVGTGWTSKRPVYAVPNPLLAEAMTGRAPIWKPGGQISQLASLVEPLALTRLDSSHVRVVHESVADYDPVLTETFKIAVRNLQSDLAVSAPETAEAIHVLWEDFADYEVAVLPDLRVRVDLPGGTNHQVKLAAWLDPVARTLFASAPDEVARARSGGFSIASLFDANPRDVAHAWVVAWSDAQAGAEAELVVSAAERAAEEKRRREASQAALLKLSNPGTTSGRAKLGKSVLTKRTAPKPDGAGAQSTRPKARTLVDPDSLVLRTPDGVLVTRKPDGSAAGTSSGGVGARDSGGKGKLKDPDPSQPKKPGAGRGPLNYTPEERESTGLELLRRVMAADYDVTLTDVRHQPNVGADVVDNRGRYYELKVHGGAIPDTVKLENSQIQRALTTDEFYLVLVGGVEEGQGNPEVRITHDPLHHLAPEPHGAVHLSGVLSADIAVSWSFAADE